MKVIGLIVENYKELNDYIEILNFLSKKVTFKVKIILLADIYYDTKQYNVLEKINFLYEILKVENTYKKPFKNYSFLEKIQLIRKFSREADKYLKNISLLLSGVQTVFERVLYSYIKKNNLPIKVIVYHRHLLFDDSVNTSGSKLVYNSIVYQILDTLNLSGLLIEKKAVGFADKYLVLGDINKQYLINKGVNPETIYTVGSIEYDLIEQYVQPQRTHIKDICYITSACEWIGDIEGEKYQREKIINFINFCNENNYNLTFRIHPREDFKKYEALKGKYPFIKLQYPSNIKLLEDLAGFDVIVGGFSTVLFEVMLINKKVIFYSLKEEEYRYKELLNNFTLPYLTDLKDFNKVISLNENIEKYKFIKYDKNEKAIDRITKIIEEELNVK